MWSGTASWKRFTRPARSSDVKFPIWRHHELPPRHGYLLGPHADDPNTTLDIAVEINAEFPAGVSNQIKRAVTENAMSLGFKMKGWE